MSLQFMELEPVYNDDYGTEDAANLNFAAGATPATEGTDPSDKPDKTASTNTLTAQAAGPNLKPSAPSTTAPTTTGPLGRTLTAKEKMRQKINNNRRRN